MALSLSANGQTNADYLMKVGEGSDASRRSRIERDGAVDHSVGRKSAEDRRADRNDVGRSEDQRSEKARGARQNDYDHASAAEKRQERQSFKDTFAEQSKTESSNPKSRVDHSQREHSSDSTAPTSGPKSKLSDAADGSAVAEEVSSSGGVTEGTHGLQDDSAIGGPLGGNGDVVLDETSIILGEGQFATSSHPLSRLVKEGANSLGGLAGTSLASELTDDIELAGASSTLPGALPGGASVGSPVAGVGVASRSLTSATAGAQSGSPSAIHQHQTAFVDKTVASDLKNLEILNVKGAEVLGQAVVSANSSSVMVGDTLSLQARGLSATGLMAGAGNEVVSGTGLNADKGLILDKSALGLGLGGIDIASESTAPSAMARLDSANAPGASGQHLGRVQIPVNISFGRPEWSGMVAERSAMMAAQNLSFAELQLDPPELGPLQVKIAVSQDQQASVTFVSANPQVRDALEQTVGRLKELLEEQGINLSDSDVSDQASDTEQEFAEGERGANGEGGEDLAEGEESSSTVQASMAWGVDHYA